LSRDPAIRYATPGHRLLALLIDVLLLLFLLNLLRFLPVLVDPQLMFQPAAPVEPWGGAAWLALLLAAMLASALFWTCCAATPGKLLAGLRVISARSGGTPGLHQGLLRFAAYGLSLLPAGLGFLWAFRDRRGQALHDKLSRTLVLVDDESGKPLAQLLREATGC
jgi:uncharacterized RDD family membrane protein YckC